MCAGASGCSSFEQQQQLQQRHLQLLGATLLRALKVATETSAMSYLNIQAVEQTTKELAITKRLIINNE